MTKAELKAAIAKADADGMPDSADVLFDGAAVSPNYNIELGKFDEAAAGGESVEVKPSLQLLHLS